MRKKTAKRLKRLAQAITANQTELGVKKVYKRLKKAKRS
jgi:hypothetical protein